MLIFILIDVQYSPNPPLIEGSLLPQQDGVHRVFPTGGDSLLAADILFIPPHLEIIFSPPQK